MDAVLADEQVGRLCFLPVLGQVVPNGMVAAVVNQYALGVLDHVETAGAGVFERLCDAEDRILALGWMQVELDLVFFFDQVVVDKEFAEGTDAECHERMASL